MKINFNYEFTELDGTVIPEQPDEFEEKKDGRKITKKYPPFTLKKVCEFVVKIKLHNYLLFKMAWFL